MFINSQEETLTQLELAKAKKGFSFMFKALGYFTVVLVLFLLSCGQNVSNPAVPSSENEEIVDREISVQTAQIRYVATSGDDTSNDCLAAANPCSTIQHAIDSAVAGDTIDIAVGTYNEHDIIVDKDLILKGAGADSTVIDAEGLGRVILVESDLESTIDSLTVTGGNAAASNFPLNKFFGSGIFNNGNLTIANSIVTENICTGGNCGWNGGGIFNGGKLTIDNSTINKNEGYSTGGGIYNEDELNITNSTISENYARSSGVGGAIYNDEGILHVTNSTISNNFAIYSAGIESYRGTVTITNSTITNHQKGNRYSHPINYGGGISNYYGTLSVINSTISNNRARYGGGGIVNENGTLNVINSTISNNSSQGVDGFGNNALGGGIHLYGSAVTNLENAIIADNLGGDCYNSSGNNSQGYNLDSDGTCNLTKPTDKPNIDPRLEPLADNGGPTQTHALAVDSPAINAIPIGENGCGTDITTDQRGETRPFGIGCEIGAFEISPVEATNHLMDYVAAANLNQGTKQALLNSLEAALEKINAEQNHVASNILEAFINKVNAQYGKKITPADASKFTLLTKTIISGL